MTGPETDVLTDLRSRIAADPLSAALCLDFDGVLAPIVEDPEKSAMPEEVASVVTELVGALGAVALISGRPAAFLAERAAAVQSAGGRLLGLYGLQEWDGRRARAHPDAAGWQDAVAAAARRLQLRFASVQGIFVEDKGLGVAVHWRNAGDDAERARAGRAVEAAVREEARVDGLAVEPGKLVLELRPPVAWDKGDGVRRVAAESAVELVVYAGDDLGDLPAFAAVRELGGVAIAVDHGGETDPRVLAAGDVVVAGTSAMADWLQALRTDVVSGRGSS